MRKLLFSASILAMGMISASCSKTSPHTYSVEGYTQIQKANGWNSFIASTVRVKNKGKTYHVDVGKIEYGNVKSPKLIAYIYDYKSGGSLANTDSDKNTLVLPFKEDK